MPVRFQANSASSFGGGIYNFPGAVVINESTISYNMANAGGGIHIRGGIVITGSTISANSAVTNGGGIYFSFGGGTLRSSTLSGNTAANSSGIFNFSSEVMALSTIVAGTTNTEIIGSHNLIDGNFGLGPLADNGGPTYTHALLPDSPALDAGESASTSDQRGFGVPVDLQSISNAVGGNASDIGAYEAQILPSADFDEDGNVDGHDFLTWQRGFGIAAGAERLDGNSDDDGDVDSSDLAAWEVSYVTNSLPSADFDGDGAVTGFDFLAWQQGFGTPAPLAVKSDGDADNDTDVDGDDLTAWAHAYGAGAPVGAAAEDHSERAVSSPTTVAVSPAQLVDLAMAVAWAAPVEEANPSPGPSLQGRGNDVAALRVSLRRDEDAAGVVAREHLVDFAEDLVERDLAHERPESLDDIPLGGELFPDF